MSSDISLTPPVSPTHRDHALPPLMREHRAWMEAAARRELGDAALAEEVAQDAFLRLAALPRPPADPAALRTWLLRCVWYLSANARRKAMRRRAAEADAAAALPALKTTDAVPEEDLDGALETLPELERALVLEHYFEGRAHGEIGLRHGLSGEAARKRIARALDRMRRHLTRKGVAVPAAAVAAGFGARPGHALAATGPWAALVPLMNSTVKTAAVTAALCAGLAFVPLTLQQQRINALTNYSLNPEVQATSLAAPSASRPVNPKDTSAGAAVPADASPLLREFLRALPEIESAPAGQPNAALIRLLGDILREPSADRREPAFRLLCGLLKAEDLETAEKLFEEQGRRGVLRVAEYAAFAYRKGQVLGKKALTDKVGETPVAVLDRISSALLEGWASRHPKEVWKWLAEMPDHLEFRKQAYGPLFESAARDHPSLALKMAENAPPATTRRMLMELAKRELDTHGADGLQKWFLGLKEHSKWDPAKKDIAFLVAERQCFAGAEPALRTLRAGMDQPWGGEELARKVAERFGRVNEGKVIAMLELLPAADPLTPILTDTLFTTMAKEQRNLAADFLDKHPDFPHYDRATAAFVRGIRKIDPEAATAWAGTLKDPAKREALLLSVEE